MAWKPYSTVRFDKFLFSTNTTITDLRQSEVDRIKEQLRAFEDNMMDVAVLQNDAESKINAEVKVETLHNRLADLQASIHDQEYEAMSKICELEKQLNQRTEDLEKMKGTGRGVYALPGIGLTSLHASAECNRSYPFNQELD